MYKQSLYNSCFSTDI